MDPRVVIDGALELSIVGSFTRPGYHVRRRLFAWSDPRPGSLEGKTVLITGPTSGLGRATADAIAALGARIILAGRSEQRLARVRDELTGKYGGDRYPSLVVDMSSLSSIRAAIERIHADEDRLDVVVDNAGAINPERIETEDGLEATFATMTVGPFSLVAGLLPLLAASGDGRVISVVSGGMYFQPLPLDDLQFERGDFDGTRAYARAKRASTALVREWSRRYHGPVRFDAMHPGWADTPGLAESLPGFYGFMRPILRTPEEGTDTIIWLATDQTAGRRDGNLYLDRRPRPFDRMPATRLSAAERRRLWDVVVRLADVPDPTAEPDRG
ncbi:MAG: SDR family NAD(P)-dependent oxidoreductase [Candidatus Limnocylindrales bacterium]